MGLNENKRQTSRWPKTSSYLYRPLEIEKDTPAGGLGCPLRHTHSMCTHAYASVCLRAYMHTQLCVWVGAWDCVDVFT